MDASPLRGTAWILPQPRRYFHLRLLTRLGERARLNRSAPLVVKSLFNPDFLIAVESVAVVD